MPDEAYCSNCQQSGHTVHNRTCPTFIAHQQKSDRIYGDQQFKFFVTRDARTWETLGEPSLNAEFPVPNPLPANTQVGTSARWSRPPQQRNLDARAQTARNRFESGGYNKRSAKGGPKLTSANSIPMGQRPITAYMNLNPASQLPAQPESNNAESTGGRNYEQEGEAPEGWGDAANDPNPWEGNSIPPANPSARERPPTPTPQLRQRSKSLSSEVFSPMRMPSTSPSQAPKPLPNTAELEAMNSTVGSLNLPDFRWRHWGRKDRRAASPNYLDNIPSPSPLRTPTSPPPTSARPGHNPTRK